jgi:fructose/tagatose bisphosphate aldolase
MRSDKANKMLAALAEKASKAFDAEAVAAELLAIREIAKDERDPAIIKILRLAAEYIQSNEGFDLGYVESDEEEVVEMSDFEYLIELIIHADREANKAEIKEIRDLLIAELY